MKASAWLDKNRPVEQMTWAPGLPMLVCDRLISDGGWIERNGVTCFSLYRPPARKLGNADKAGPWLTHAKQVFGDDVAGKDFVTLAAIKEMRRKCRVPTKESGFGSDQQAATPAEKSSKPHDGLSGTADDTLAQTAALALARKLKSGSPTASPRSTSRNIASVHCLKSRSPT
jgi:hypothetical protein